MESLISEIERLSMEIARLREHRDKLNVEAKDWRRRGEELLEEARRLKVEART